MRRWYLTRFRQLALIGALFCATIVPGCQGMFGSSLMTLDTFKIGGAPSGQHEPEITYEDVKGERKSEDL